MKLPARNKYIRAVLVSAPISVFVAFTVWSVIDYLTYFSGGYEQNVKEEINAFDRTVRGIINENAAAGEPLSVKHALDYIQIPPSLDLIVSEATSKNIIYSHRYSGRWLDRCCEGLYLRSIVTKTIENYSFQYSYYIIPKFYASFLRAISFSLLPDYITDKYFSFSKWADSFFSYFWARSAVYYGMFLISFVAFFAWSIRNLSYDEQRQIAYELLSEERERLEASASEVERYKTSLLEINKMIALKQQELEIKHDILKRSMNKRNSAQLSKSIDDATKETISLKSERGRLERELAAISDVLIEESKNIQDTQISARIADIKVEFSELFGSKMPNALIDQISEGFYLYERSPEYISQIMHAWFNGFDYLVKKLAEPFWQRNKKHLLLGEAIKIIRKIYAPHQIDYYELKAVVNMRNKFSHFETDVLTIDNLRSLKSRLFGYKNTDGLFYKLVNVKNKK
ncbi:MAG: hypothetical protein LBF86_07730 [Helicobacteraceae bacterium]|jgi:hypothetical protein|nr:hypothetical protein [Helicobacteraceae bacterium]